MRRGSNITCWLLLALLAAPAAVLAKEEEEPTKKELKAAEAALAEKYRRWLDEVYYLISEDERNAFLEIEKDYQRDAFIERFWRIRDPYPDTPRNEFRENWYERLDYVLTEFEDLLEDRAHFFLMNGPPLSALEFRCSPYLWPLEVWFYDGSERVRDEFYLLFYKRDGGRKYYLWQPTRGIDELAQPAQDLRGLRQKIYNCRDGDVLLKVISYLLRGNGMDFEMLVARLSEPTENPSPEWLASFSAYSTDVEEGAAELPAELAVAFPERYQSRTVVAASVVVETTEAAVERIGGAETYNFLLTGEVLQDGELFENFRYKFDFPLAEVQSESIPLLFERRLRPGQYTLIVKVEDLNSDRIFRRMEELDVPHLEETRVLDPETEEVLDAAQEVLTAERPTVEIVEPRGEMHTGMMRFDILTTGPISAMRFSLDGRSVVTKRRPPWSIDFDLGGVPRNHVLQAVALDAEGNELAADELVINAGKHRFDVRLVEPRTGVTYSGEVRATAEVLTPEEKVTERVEFYLNETLLATLYQPPYTHLLTLPAGGGIAYVETVAYLSDGNSTRDGVFVNGPDFVEEVDIEYVELYTTVLDKQGRPIQDLARDELAVFEDGQQQEIRRFEKVEDLPIHAQVMIDVSASMEESLEETKRAALEFVEETIQPKDRVALITFNDHPRMAVQFTNDHRELAGGLAGLVAERGTALYDAMIFGLYYLNGIKGQRTILLLSDGKDESSRFSWEDTLEYARRAGVAIYAIGLDITGKNSSQARKKLTDLADETGGRSFFIEEATELEGVYRTIEEELRSRYLITYQSTNSAPDETFRSVELEVSRQGTEAKTIRGYYP